MTVNEQYVDLLSKIIRNEIYGSEVKISQADVQKCQNVIKDLDIRNIGIFEKYPYLRDPQKFAEIVLNSKRTRLIHTYVKKAGIDNVIDCCCRTIIDDIPGGFMEIGTLRGGIGILMAGICRAHDNKRCTYVVDSFEGLPPPSEQDSLFDNEVWHHYADLFDEHMFDCKVSYQNVVENFSRYGFTERDVRFIKGWVPDCLLGFSEPLAVVRIDVDWYRASLDSLNTIYDLVSSGGFIIVDDYKLEGCRQAVDEFFKAKKINSVLQTADEKAGIVFWRKV